MTMASELIRRAQGQSVGANRGRIEPVPVRTPPMILHTPSVPNMEPSPAPRRGALMDVMRRHDQAAKMRAMAGKTQP